MVAEKEHMVTSTCQDAVFADGMASTIVKSCMTLHKGEMLCVLTNLLFVSSRSRMGGHTNRVPTHGTCKQESVTIDLHNPYS